MFLCCFADVFGSPGGAGNKSPLAFGPQNEAQIDPTTAKHGVKKYIYFRTILFLLILGPHGPRSANMGPRRSPRTSKGRKATRLYNTFRVSRQLSRGTWRDLIRPEKRVPKIDLDFSFFFGITFGTDLGARIDLELSPKLVQNRNRIHVNLFIGVFNFY